MKVSGPKLWLHAEGLVVLVAATVIYSKLEGAWSMFAVLFLVPDLAMLGYVGGKQLGAGCYNLAHTYVSPALFIGIAYASGHLNWLPLAAIWVAHIGFDRLLGYGLKYPTTFKDTHLHRV
jgi:hypothetical protein